MWPARMSILCQVLSVLASTTALHAQQVSPQLQAVLQNAAHDEKVPVIITFTDRMDISRFSGHSKRLRRQLISESLRTRALRTRKPLRKFLRDRGATRFRSLWLINGLAVEMPARLVDRIARLPGIAKVSLDYTLQLPPVKYDDTPAVQWNLEMICAPALWDIGLTGQGVVVATMDSGVDIDHPDLKDNWRGGSNSWYDVHAQTDIPYDTNGHGTQVMGIIAGTGPTGIAPGVQWIAVRVFDEVNDAAVSDVHLGFQWLLDPDGDPNTDDAPDIVNNSWNLRDNAGQCIDEFADDIGTLKAAGIAVIFAAGNEGPSAASCSSPANYAGSFSVGAVNANLQIALYSSRGPSPCHNDIFPNLVAPGTNIATTDLSFGGTNNYASVNGTSYAAPHAAGALALLLNAFGHATIEDLQSALRHTALDLGAQGPDYDYGHGLIDVAAAYNSLHAAQSQCPPDTDQADTDGNGITDDDNVCVNLTAQDNNGDYSFQLSGDFIDPGNSLIRLRQGQKLYLTFSNPEGFPEPLGIQCLGYSPAVPIFAGSPLSSFAVAPAGQFTYYYNANQPGTYPLLAASETGKVCPAAQIRVEPIQNLSLPAGEQLAYHTHLPGDKYAYNDGDGSTHYDLEHSLALGTDNDYSITAQQGQKILLRISNPSSAGYHTLGTLGIPMTVIAKGARLLKAPNGTRLYYQTSSITLGAGQSIDVIIDTTNVPPGTYFLYTTNTNHLTNNTQDFGGIITEIQINPALP